jgi:hypothetical protein
MEQAGKIIFPNFHTIWHFDDKVGQKYLLEAIGAPLVKSYSFYDYNTVKQWIAETEFPKVFKLRGGAGSSNVKLVRTRYQAFRLARKMFSLGINRFDKWEYLKESIRKWHEKKASVSTLFNAIAHLVIPPKGARTLGPERGYIYFQDFIPDNSYDIRIIVIGKRAFSLKRWCRDNDFRASGSGRNDFSLGKQSEKCAEISFRVASLLKTQSCAFDFVFQDGKPQIVEISYGFSESAYFDCLGFWDEAMRWHDEPVRPSEWILEDMLAECGKPNVSHYPGDSVNLSLCEYQFNAFSEKSDRM